MGLMGFYRSLGVLILSNRSLWVHIGPYASPSVLMCAYGSFCVLIGPYEFEWVFIRLMGPY